jgi:hypothetical protein
VNLQRSPSRTTPHLRLIHQWIHELDDGENAHKQSVWTCHGAYSVESSHQHLSNRSAFGWDCPEELRPQWRLTGTDPPEPIHVTTLRWRGGKTDVVNKLGH